MTEPRTRYTLACVQTAPAFGEVDANLDHVERLLEGLTADLVVLPEFFSSGYSFKDRVEAADYAEPFGTGYGLIDRLLAWSRGTGAAIVAGYVERDGARLYNAAGVVANGELLQSYRKLHLFGFEKEVFDPGDRPLEVVEHDGLKIGTMICFDWIFPEATRVLALGGADVIAHPSNLVLPGWCQRAMGVRSIENRVFSVTANRYGVEHREPRPRLAFTGASQIVTPDGEVVTAAEQQGDQVLVAEVDVSLARNKQIASGNDVFGDRRPNWYSDLV